MNNNLLEWLLAIIFDRLKVSNPKILAWIIGFAVAAEAFIIYATTTNLFGSSTLTEIALAFFAGIIALGAGMAGTRTTRYINHQKMVVGKQFVLNAARTNGITQTRSLFVAHKSASIQLGVENIKLVLADFLTVVMSIRDILRDLSFKNILSIGGKLLELLFLIQNFIGNISLAGRAWEEFKELDAAEAKEVRDYLKDFYEDDKEELEAIVDDGFELIPAIHSMVMSYFSAFRNTLSVWSELKQYKDRIEGIGVSAKIAA